MFPWQWIDQKIFKAVSIDGFIYCLPCAKKVTIEMQNEEFLKRLNMNTSERKDYYSKLQKQIEFNELREKVKEGEGFDELVELDEVDKMKRLLKPRDGSVQTKTIRESIIENIKKSDLRNSEKKIILGGSDVTGK